MMLLAVMAANFAGAQSGNSGEPEYRPKKLRAGIGLLTVADHYGLGICPTLQVSASRWAAWSGFIVNAGHWQTWQEFPSLTVGAGFFPGRAKDKPARLYFFSQVTYSGWTLKRTGLNPPLHEDLRTWRTVGLKAGLGARGQLSRCWYFDARSGFGIGWLYYPKAKDADTGLLFGDTWQLQFGLCWQFTEAIFRRKARK